MEGAGKSSLPIGVLTWHLGHFVVVLFWLRRDESPLFCDSFQVVFSAHCSIENLESASMTVSWLAQVFLLNFLWMIGVWKRQHIRYISGCFFLTALSPFICVLLLIWNKRLLLLIFLSKGELPLIFLSKGVLLLLFLNKKGWGELVAIKITISDHFDFFSSFFLIALEETPVFLESWWVVTIEAIYLIIIWQADFKVMLLVITLNWACNSAAQNRKWIVWV